jgi:4-amino-4-deoxy-L-arabinose transferase-like glycosyltransferase
VRRSAVAIVVGFVAVATVYSLVTPIWEAPDEVGHMAYVMHLVERRALPVQRPETLGEEHHPPLYYVLAAVPVALFADLDDPAGRFRFNRGIVWGGEGGSDANAALHGDDEGFPYRGHARAVHVARLVSIALAAVTVALTIAIGREAFPGVAAVPLFAGVLVAGNPQFVFISASVNNDNLVNAIAAALLLCAIRAVTREVSLAHWLSVAALATTGFLTKLSIAPVVAVVFGVLVLQSLRAGRRDLVLRGTLATVVVLALGLGWWIARNVRVYGDPLGWSVYARRYARAMRDGRLPWSEYATFVGTQFRSFWGVFGWMTVDPPRWLHGAAAVLGVVAAIGLGWWARGRSTLPRSPRVARAVTVLVAAIVAQELYLIVAIRSTFGSAWYQGRYLFPVISAAGVVMSAGVLAIVPPPRRRLTVVGLTVAMLAIVLWNAFAVIAPAYGPAG